MKFTKFTTIIALTFLVAIMLSACTNNAEPEETSSESTAQNESNKGSETKTTDEPEVTEDPSPITIQYWHSHNERQMDVLHFMIDEFQKEYPYITVEEVYQGGYADLSKKLQAALAANDVPAVSMSEVSYLPNFADSGAFADLTPYIQKDNVDMNDFSKGMLDAYAYNGNQYAMPIVVSAGVFVYNKTMLEEIGIDPPQTWADIEEFNEKVTVRENGETTQYAFSVPGWGSWYIDPWIINGGGNIFSEDGKTVDFDQEGNLKWLENFRKWTQEGSVHMGYGPGASANMRQMFLDQKVAMVMHSSATLKATYLPNADFEVGVSFLPGDKKRISQIGGAGIVIMEKAPENEKEAAWKFVNFMTGPQYNIKFARETGYLPTHKSVVTSEEGIKYFEEFPQFKTVLDNFDSVIGRPQNAAYTEISTIYMEPIGKMILEDADPIPLMLDSVKKMNEIIKDYE